MSYIPIHPFCVQIFLISDLRLKSTFQNIMVRFKFTILTFINIKLFSYTYAILAFTFIEPGKMVLTSNPCLKIKN